MTKLSEIESFLEPKKLAIAGVSRSKKKFGRMVYEHLKDNGYECYPVNPHLSELDGDKVYQSIAELPADVDRILIVTPAKETEESVKQTIDKGIKNIWIQQQSDTEEALKLLDNKDVNLIHHKCIFMFADPVKGAHAFHRFLSKLFGKYPRN